MKKKSSSGLPRMKGGINGTLVRCKASTLKPKTSKNGKKRLPLALIDSNVEASGGHSCIECGKMFGSNKALYGHLRCHPDRNWRGFKNSSVGAAAGPLLGKACRFSSDELEVADALLVLAGGPCPVEILKQALVSPESRFNYKEEPFLVQQACPREAECCGDQVATRGCLGSIGCSRDRTESEAWTLMDTGEEEEEQNVAALLSGESLMLCLASGTGSLIKNGTAQPGIIAKRDYLNPLPVLIEGNDSLAGTGTVNGFVLDLSLHL